MKVFLSHNSKDKSVVEPIAVVLRGVFGQENVFYDSWSIQPGDSIVEEMGRGLEECDCFLWFVSKNSLNSQMVKLEWQAALTAKAKKKLRFIPVRLDQSELPPIVQQVLCIDIYKCGLEAGIRQIVDVLSGCNTYQGASKPFSNLRAYAKPCTEGFALDIEIRAEHFMEPVGRFAVLLCNDNVRLECMSDVMFMSGKSQIPSKGTTVVYAYSINVNRAISPGFPLRLRISSDKTMDNPVIMHAESEEQYASIPSALVLPSGMFGSKEDILLPLDELFASGISQNEQLDIYLRCLRNAGVAVHMDGNAQVG